MDSPGIMEPAKTTPGATDRVVRAPLSSSSLVPLSPPGSHCQPPGTPVTETRGLVIRRELPAGSQFFPLGQAVIAFSSRLSTLNQGGEKDRRSEGAVCPTLLYPRHRWLGRA